MTHDGKGSGVDGNNLVCNGTKKQNIVEAGPPAPIDDPRCVVSNPLSLKHFQVKWIRFTVENAARGKKELIPCNRKRY